VGGQLAAVEHANARAEGFGAAAAAAAACAEGIGREGGHVCKVDEVGWGVLEIT
jgi:hypothetical protein